MWCVVRGAALVLGVGLVWGGIWLISEIDFSALNRPDPVYEWHHPTLTEEDARIQRAKCEFDAVKRFGAAFHIHSQMSRERCTELCLEVNGIVLEQVNGGESAE